VSQTNFEDAPVTVGAQVTTSGYAGQMLAAQLVDEFGQGDRRAEGCGRYKDGEPSPCDFACDPSRRVFRSNRVRVAADGQWRSSMAERDRPKRRSEQHAAGGGSIAAKGP